MKFLSVIGALLSLLVLGAGSVVAEESKCSTTYGIEVKVSEPWSIGNCTKENQLETKKQPNTLAFRLRNQRTGELFDLVLKKDPGPGFNDETFTKWAMSNYARDGSNQLQYRKVNAEKDEKVELVVNGVNYTIRHETYSINESSDGTVRHKRPVAFVWFRFPGYEGFGFMRVVGDEHTKKPNGQQKFSSTELGVEQVKDVLGSMTLRSGIAAR